MKDVVAIGDVNVDILTSPINSYPKKDSQVIIPQARMEIGGGAAHFALALAKMGIKVKMIGCVGKDFLGDFVLREMRKFGVNCKIRKKEGKSTGISIGISFKDGSRSLITFRGTNSIFSTRDFEQSEIRGKILYIGGYNLLENFQKDVKRILSLAKRRKMITCLEPDLKSGISCNLDELMDNLKKIDFFFPDLEEGKLLTLRRKDEKIVEKLLELGVKNVALKLGSKGCIVASREEFWKIGALEVEVINPTGAGDFFNAGFIFGYLKHRSLKEAGMYGNATAAYSLTKFGSERYPSAKDVERLVRKGYELKN